MKGKVGSDYGYRANVQKIDTECLKWFLGEQQMSFRALSERTSVTDRTIRNWVRKGEMPAYLIEEICDALALESICDMRENVALHCAEPITTFRYRNDGAEDGKVTLHARIGVEIQIEKGLLEEILKRSMDDDGQFTDLEFGDDTGEIFLKNGKAAWDHYIPVDWLVADAIKAGFIVNGKLTFGKEHEIEHDGEGPGLE